MQKSSLYSVGISLTGKQNCIIRKAVAFLKTVARQTTRYVFNSKFKSHKVPHERIIVSIFINAAIYA